MLSEKLKAIIDPYFGVDERTQGKHTIVSLEKVTPAGEDWIVELVTDGTDVGFFNAVEEYYEHYDVDEEAMLWIPNRGKNGIPNSIKALVEDSEWKEDQLGCLVEELKEEIGC